MRITKKEKSLQGATAVLLYLPILALNFTACVDAPAPRRTQPGNLITQSLLDPANASATVTAAPKRFEGLKGDVPVVTIVFGGADSAEVWRCRANFELVYGDGLQKLANLPKTSSEYRAAAEEAFKRMRGDVAACRAIAPSTTAQTVTDYAATDGSFYYIVNPCVSQASSITKKQGCSYNLEITPKIEYRNTRTAGEIEVLTELMTAEGRLYANFNNMRRAAEEANESMTTCILNEASRRAAQAQLSGLVKLVSGLALAPMINGLMTGVGTALNGALNQMLDMAVPQEIDDIECPQAQVNSDYYSELQGQTVELAKGVLEARNKLSELDSQYANVEKELATFKSNSK